MAKDSEAPERLPIQTQNYIDNLIHTSIITEDEKVRIENEVNEMSEEDAFITIQYLKENQKESLDQQFLRRIK